MNSQREMQRLIRNNQLHSFNQGPNETGFILVHGQQRNFGEIILCNQLVRKYLQYSTRELKHMNIVDFMPSLIKQWHAGFVQEFSKNGGASSAMLNRTNCVFVKKKSGFVTPAMAYIKFHYSRDYDFTFVCFLSFMSEIQINRTQGTGRMRTDEILFFLCDDVDGTIMDISETCTRQLGLTQGMLNGEIISGHSLTIEDICPSLSFKRLKQLRAESELSFSAASAANAIEEVVDLDLNII
jgi:hypothetical protein